MTSANHQHIRFRGRSFPALAIEPEAPLPEWIARLDDHLAQSPSFFGNKPIVVDIAGLGLPRSGVVALVKDLSERGIRILGLTGVEQSWASADLPPILVGGRAPKDQKPVEQADRAPSSVELATGEADATLKSENPLLPSSERTVVQVGPQMKGNSQDAPLIVNAQVRSGQSVSDTEGDVTVVGSVASGAEIIAGGSIHIYGSLRGRALAGAFGEVKARIFCRRFQAELVAIAGVYLTADEIDPGLRGQAVQAWLENDNIKIARLD